MPRNLDGGGEQKEIEASLAWSKSENSHDVRNRGEGRRIDVSLMAQCTPQVEPWTFIGIGVDGSRSIACNRAGMSVASPYAWRSSLHLESRREITLTSNFDVYDKNVALQRDRSVVYPGV